MRYTPSGSASFASLFPNNELYKTGDNYIYFPASRAKVVLIQYQDNMI
jgi:hypothetical protein